MALAALERVTLRPLANRGFHCNLPNESRGRDPQGIVAALSYAGEVFEMRLLVIFGGLAFFFVSAFPAWADAKKGEEIFNDMQKGDCKSCHRVDSRKLVGPGLANVTKRHSDVWLKKFLKDPQGTWSSDHPETLELKKRVRKTRVPITVCKKNPMTSDQLQDLVDYLSTLEK